MTTRRKNAQRGSLGWKRVIPPSKTVILVPDLSNVKIDRFTHFFEADTGRVLSNEMWNRTKEFFRKHLKA